MRQIFVGFAVMVALAAVDSQSASAQNTTNPYCIRDGVAGPGMWDCSFYTMQQCLDSASGNGGTCGPNPFYQGPRRKSAPRRQQQQEGTWGWSPRGY
jgi:hypothetical protein